ncbi:ALG6, ALG8 glycosyltransferase family-domain-containing protein [Dipodascopsis tothii]|uniref:ALG6, ALG8 glycosyltransferase family-domain-containing protein n=1 Tax=Dipodascopsis tothii TaxID=44089 RepID=UPI0034CF60CF
MSRQRADKPAGPAAAAARRAADGRTGRPEARPDGGPDASDSTKRAAKRPRAPAADAGTPGRGRPQAAQAPQGARTARPVIRVPGKAAKAAAAAAPAPPDEPTAPLEVFLSTFKAARTQWVARQVTTLIGLLFRFAVGLGSYSGAQTPPMFGDFEAQRHWMEITLHLPVRKWYWYDLPYWGLDYPPLTAYHSWALGWLGSWIDPAWFALDASRGAEGASLKTYMRVTVALSELAVYVPAVRLYVKRAVKERRQAPLQQSVLSAAVLFQPATLLVDHGHFQYNTVMLGLATLALAHFADGRLVVGSVFFVLALSFKQMALYYALPVFAYLLGLCVFPRPNPARLVALGAAVAATFAAVWAPVVVLAAGGAAGVPREAAQVLHRIFPFARGLWEDKVANLWCTANTAVKLKSLFLPAQLQRAALAATLAAVLPACAGLFLYPRKHALVWATAASAWGFYLFSFQVHEKSVLLPLLPTTLLLADGLDPLANALVYWINNIAVFSLWPLLRRDGLALQYAAVVFLWNWLLATPARLPPRLLPRLLVLASYAAVAALHVAEYAWPAPANLPDLYVVANITLCFGCFVLFFAWTYYRLALALTAPRPGA